MKGYNIMDIIKRTIYNPRLILEAYSFEKNYYKLLGLNDDEQAPQIILFIIANILFKYNLSPSCARPI